MRRSVISALLVFALSCLGVGYVIGTQSDTGAQGPWQITTISAASATEPQSAVQPINDFLAGLGPDCEVASNQIIGDYFYIIYRC